MVLSFILPSALFANPNMHEGMLFPMPPVPVAYTQCLTKKDMIPQKKNQVCTTISNKIAVDTLTWAIQCKDKNGVTDSTGKITYKSNSFVGTVHKVMKDTEGSKSESTLQMSGKRTDDCN